MIEIKYSTILVCPIPVAGEAFESSILRKISIRTDHQIEKFLEKAAHHTVLLVNETGCIWKFHLLKFLQNPFIP